MKYGWFGVVGVAALWVSFGFGQTVPAPPPNPPSDPQPPNQALPQPVPEVCSLTSLPGTDLAACWAGSADASGPQAQTWFSAEYLLWWIKETNLPILAGTASVPEVAAGGTLSTITPVIGGGHLDYGSQDGYGYPGGYGDGSGYAYVLPGAYAGL